MSAPRHKIRVTLNFEFTVAERDLDNAQFNAVFGLAIDAVRTEARYGGMLLTPGCAAPKFKYEIINPTSEALS